jgi:hypothetical protein
MASTGVTFHADPLGEEDTHASLRVPTIAEIVAEVKQAAAADADGSKSNEEEKETEKLQPELASLADCFRYIHGSDKVQLAVGVFFAIVQVKLLCMCGVLV